MKQVYTTVGSMLLVLCSMISQAQQTVATNTNAAVPPLVNFSGVLADEDGKPLARVVAVTFSLYAEQTGGAALWMETQNVQPDQAGHYTVMLGSTSSKGLPADIFVAGEAHWLGVQVSGEAEQPRVLLVSAPYALKAGDAQTLGGLPASAFVLAGAQPAAVASSESGLPTTASGNASASPATSSDVTTTGGTVNAIPLFSTATNIQNSILTQPSATTVNVGGRLNLPNTGAATATLGRNSHPQTLVASAFDSSTDLPMSQMFQWQAEPASNNTASPSATLNLLFGSGTTPPVETGLSIAGNGQINFAPGQTFVASTAANFSSAITGTTSGSSTGDYGVEGVATASSGLGAGVYGTGDSPSGYGVVGSSPNVGVFGTTTGFSSTGYGVEGYVNSDVGGGAGVYGSAGLSATAVGVEGVSSTLGVLGNATGSSSYGVEGTSPNVGLFGNGTGATGIGVDGHGVFIGLKGVATGTGGLSGYFGGGPLEVAGNGNNALFGDPGCGSGFSGFGLTAGTLSGCNNYTLIGKNSGDVYLNSTSTGSIHFRNGNSGGNSNGDLATIDNAGNLSVAGTVHSGNALGSATYSNYTVASTGDCLVVSSAPDSNCLTPGMSVTVTTSGGPVLVMANLGVFSDPCVQVNFYLVMDNQFISAQSYNFGGAGNYSLFTATLTSLQTPAAGTHVFQVQENDSSAQCGSGDYWQTNVSPYNLPGPGAARTLIVREF